MSGGGPSHLGPGGIYCVQQNEKRDSDHVTCPSLESSPGSHCSQPRGHAPGLYLRSLWSPPFTTWGCTCGPQFPECTGASFPCTCTCTCSWSGEISVSCSSCCLLCILQKPVQQPLPDMHVT